MTGTATIVETANGMSGAASAASRSPKTVCQTNEPVPAQNTAITGTVRIAPTIARLM